jgi:AraC-like DNA-binding protein
MPDTGAPALDFRARSASLQSVLRVHTLLDRDGLQVTDVACRHEARQGHFHEAQHHAVVFVRRGCFVRQAAGAPQVLDPTSVYCINPGDEQRYDHPDASGDECTSVRVDARRLASLWGGDPTFACVALQSSPRVDLEHRLLLAAVRRREPPDELVERTISLVASALERADPRRVASGRPTATHARAALVDAARQSLAADPGLSVPDLAAALHVSPHHLSRIFRAHTGHTISRHRMRLRARAALERLAHGERDLTRLAAELGFTDHSHLCRVLREETGHAPSGLRELLGDGPPLVTADPLLATLPDGSPGAASVTSVGGGRGRGRGASLATG